MLEKVIQKILFKKVMDNGEKKDAEYIKNMELTKPQGDVIHKGYEFQYLENIAAAARMMNMSKTNASLYNRCEASYTLYYEDRIYLNNYKKQGIYITYEQLADCKRNGNVKFNKGRGIVKLKLEDNSKWQMFVCGADKDRDKEQVITNEIKELINQKCGIQII